MRDAGDGIKKRGWNPPPKPKSVAFNLINGKLTITSDAIDAYLSLNRPFPSCLSAEVSIIFRAAKRKSFHMKLMGKGNFANYFHAQQTAAAADENQLNKKNNDKK